MDSSDVRPRRWLQFSLRTLFVLMCVVAAFFGGRESMRPMIQAERLRAERARADALLQQAAALMELDRAVAAERQSRVMLQQAQSAFDEAAAATDPSSSRKPESGSP